MALSWRNWLGQQAWLYPHQNVLDGIGEGLDSTRAPWPCPCQQYAGTGSLVGLCLSLFWDDTQRGGVSCALPVWAHNHLTGGRPLSGQGKGRVTCALLCPHLPALLTYLAVLRLLQAEAAGVDLAFCLRVDLNELVILGVPTGLGALWGALFGSRKGLGSDSPQDFQTPLPEPPRPSQCTLSSASSSSPPAPCPSAPEPHHSPLRVGSHSSPPPAQAPGHSKYAPAEGQTAGDTHVTFPFS